MKKAGGGFGGEGAAPPSHGVFVGRFYCRRDLKEMEQEKRRGECNRYRRMREVRRRKL